MGVLKNVGRWIGSLFVLCDWHADGSGSAVRDAAPQRDDRGDKDAKRAWTGRWGGGGNEPLTPEIMAREPAATPAPPPKPATIHRLDVKFHDENPDLTRAQWDAIKTRGTPVPVLTPLRHVRMLSLIQTFDAATRGRLNAIRAHGQYDTTNLLEKQWLGVGPDHIVVWGGDAVSALRDLVKATVYDVGGLSPEFVVEVRWAAGGHSTMNVDLREANWLGLFGEAFERSAQGQ